MIRALVTKELRETSAYAGLALVLSLAYVCRQIGLWNLVLRVWSRDSPTGPFSPSSRWVLGQTFGLIGFALALTLGFRQSCWDFRHGTTLYLLHLPVRRRTYFLTKLSTGIGLLLASMSLPMLLYAGWAAWPGSHPAPFEWSMIGPALRLWLLMPMIYLGAFASGIRPGAGSAHGSCRCSRSRFLPSGSTRHSWLAGLPVLGLVSAAFISDILLEVATRDF